jgi:hypothetical protein
MRTSILVKPILLISLLFGSALSGSFVAAHPGKEKACECKLAPRSLNGYTINYQILDTKTALNDIAYKGVVVTEYHKKSFKAQGTGTQHDNSDPAKEYFEGSYKYKVVDCNTAVETASTTLPYSPRTTYLTFTSAHAGTWEQRLDKGRVTRSGKFSLVKTAADSLAPDSIAGLHVALVIKSTVSDLPPESYPRAGLVLQTYKDDGSMTFAGTGPGTIHSIGTYSYKKVSPNTGVEETVQTSDFFSLPYTMVYTFETKNSGTWEQNFGNGLIKFSGTFDKFPAQ